MPLPLRLIRSQIALLDDEDYPAFAHFRWRLNNKGYAIRSYINGDKTILICLHREIMQARRGC